ncbi:hypothetical protein V7128_27335, partial [Neobacillus vireti]|uniref:hypothetical protein n=1 Tax=Neobacillus vireti TaxID=220686 RepID=UPI002FFF3092
LVFKEQFLKDRFIIYHVIFFVSITFSKKEKQLKSVTRINITKTLLKNQLFFKAFINVLLTRYYSTIIFLIRQSFLATYLQDVSGRVAILHKLEHPEILTIVSSNIL